MTGVVVDDDEVDELRKGKGLRRGKNELTEETPREKVVLAAPSLLKGRKADNREALTS